MSYRKKPAGEEYKKFLEQYKKCDHNGKIQLAKHYKVTIYAINHWAGEGDTPLAQSTSPDIGLLDGKKSLDKPVIEVRPLPRIKIMPVPQETVGKSEETQVVVISDLQAGQCSPTFNSKVLKQEMEVLSQKNLRLCQLHRKMRPIKKLVVCLLGDMIENMNVPIPTLEELEHVAYDQIFKVAVPILNDFLVSQLQLFDSITVYCIRGNHGQLEGRRSLSSKTNWDSFVYKILEMGLQKYKQIKFQIEDNNFYQVADIAGIPCLLVHGDRIPSYLGLPFYGIDRRTLRWNVNIPGGWKYCLMGHFHICNYIRPSGIPVFVNGTFASGTAYPLATMGLQDDPRQWILFMSGKRGVTAMYDVRVDKAL